MPAVAGSPTQACHPERGSKATESRDLFRGRRRDVPSEFVVIRRSRVELRIDDADAVYPLRPKNLLTGTADAVLESDQINVYLT